MEQKETILNKFQNMMNQDVLGVQIAIYSIAGIGLAASLYKIRPFKKLVHPSKIPKRLLELRQPQKGAVRRIEPEKFPLLLVDHYPLLRIPIIHSNMKTLPVKVLGVNLSGNGVSWMQSVVAGNQVVFVPFYTENNKCVTCIVQMKEQIRTGRTKKKPETIDIGERLVRLGLATVSPVDNRLITDKQYARYRKTLINAEANAKHRLMGIWNDFEPPPTILQKLLKYILQQIKQIQTTQIKYLKQLRYKPSLLKLSPK